MFAVSAVFNGFAFACLRRLARTSALAQPLPVPFLYRWRCASDSVSYRLNRILPTQDSALPALSFHWTDMNTRRIGKTVNKKMSHQPREYTDEHNNSGIFSR